MRPARAEVTHYRGFGWLTLLFFIYLYLPIAVVVFYSFNANRLMSSWGGFSLTWYHTALQNRALMNAVENSLIVAIISTAFAVTIATVAAFALTKNSGDRLSELSTVAINLPLLLPEIVLAVALLIMFSRLPPMDSIFKLVLAHTTFCVPFAFLPIRARLQNMSSNYAEASRDLYANSWTTFRRVTLPLIMPGVFAGAMLSFIASMDDFITSNLLNSGGATTLPVYIFSLIREGVSPQLNAISTLLIALSLFVAALGSILQRKA